MKLERLRNIAEMFNGKTNDDEKEKPIDQIENLPSRDKIKRTFQKSVDTLCEEHEQVKFSLDSKTLSHRTVATIVQVKTMMSRILSVNRMEFVDCQEKNVHPKNM